MDPARKSFVFKLAVVLVLVLVSAALVFLYLKYAKYNGKELLDYLKGTILQQDQPKAPMLIPAVLRTRRRKSWLSILMLTRARRENT